MMQVANSDRHAPRPASPGVLWDIIERHLHEAARAVERFEAALDRPTCTVRQLHRGPEERIFAHLDGLVAGGGAVTERVLLPTLEACPAPRCAMAEAIVLALFAKREREAVWRALASSESEVVGGAVRAALLKADAEFDARVMEELYQEAPKVPRARLLDLAASRRLQPRTLLPFLESEDPSEVASALRATMCPSGVSYRKTIAAHLEHPDAAVREAAMLAGLQLGLSQAWSLCRKLGLDPAAPHPLAMQLLAGLGGMEEHQCLEKLLDLDTHRPFVVRALGYAGQIDSVERLLTLIDGSGGRVSRLAVEAIATIAGLEPDVYAGSGAAAHALDAIAPGQKTQHGLGPVALPRKSSPSETSDDVEDELPDADPDALRHWWQGARGSFARGGRYVGGLPRSLPSIVCAMDKLVLRRRHTLGLILSIRTGGKIWIDTRAFALTQRKQRHRAAWFLSTLPPSILGPY